MSPNCSNFAPNYRQQPMSIVKIKDKTFKTSIPEAEIKKRVKALADRINHDMADKNPLLLAMLNGSFVFAADLMREITVPAEISFVKMSSYAGTSSTGTVKQLIGLNDDIKGRTIIIVEDIIESGLTMKAILAQLAEKQPEAIHICTLLLKPECLETQLDIRYTAFEIPNDFIVGYGLDYDQQGRNLKDIYTVVEE